MRVFRGNSPAAQPHSRATSDMQSPVSNVGHLVERGGFPAHSAFGFRHLCGDWRPRFVAAGLPALPPALHSFKAQQLRFHLSQISTFGFGFLLSLLYYLPEFAVAFLLWSMPVAVGLVQLLGFRGLRAMAPYMYHLVQLYPSVDMQWPGLRCIRCGLSHAAAARGRCIALSAVKGRICIASLAVALRHLERLRA